MLFTTTGPKRNAADQRKPQSENKGTLNSKAYGLFLWQRVAARGRDLTPTSIAVLRIQLPEGMLWLRTSQRLQNPLVKEYTFKSFKGSY